MNKNLAIAGWRTHAERRNTATAIRMQKTDLKVGFQAVVCNATYAMHAMYAHKKYNAKNRIDCVHCVFACMRCIFRFLCISASQAVRPLRNAMDSTHAGHATQIKKTATHAMHSREKCNKCKDRIGCVFAFLACVAYFSFFDCVASRVSVALHVLRMTTWKPHVVSLYVGLCDIKVFTFLWWVSGSAVRRNIVMSNYVMSNYVTLWHQQPVCQFSWCLQRDLSPLWPVIKLQ